MSIFARLPDDLQRLVNNLIRDERHITARMLLRKLCTQFNDTAKRDCVSRETLDTCKDMWEAMRALDCIDITIVRVCRRHHDEWLQSLEDPYEMRPDRTMLLKYFYSEVQPVMWYCASFKSAKKI